VNSETKYQLNYNLDVKIFSTAFRGEKTGMATRLLESCRLSWRILSIEPSFNYSALSFLNF